MSKQAITHAQHAERCVSFDPQAAAPLALAITPERKWIAVSQLQKAIRRGEPALAVEWAHALWNADRNYGLFRLAVIAAEEIACADPALARAFLHSDIKKAWFESRGGFGAMAYFADAFARSPKDRASCDLASTASLTHLDALAGPKGPLDYAALRAHAENPATPTPARISALWLLAGTQKIPNAALGAPRPGRLNDFLGACMAIEPDEDALVCVDLSLRLNKEPNPIAIPLCREARRGGVEAAPGLGVPTKIVGSGLTCALDAHTREGRSALEALLAAEPEARRLTTSMGSRAEKTRLLGALFFRLEGHDVSPRQDYALARRAHEWHRNRVARLASMPADEAFGIGAALLGPLDELRVAEASWAFCAAKAAPKP